MSVHVLRLLLVCTLLACACDRSSPARDEAPRPAPARVSSDTAFDLVALPSGGAALVWAERDHRGGLTLVWQSLGRSSEDDSARPTRRFPLSQSGSARIGDLSALPLGGGLAIAWIERDAGQSRARALRTSAAGARETFELGPVGEGDLAVRGHLAIAERGGSVVSFVRGEQEKCADPGARQCHEFRFVTLGGDPARALSLSVPEPCDRQSAMLLRGAPQAPTLPQHDGATLAWHYAVCSRVDGVPVVTAFSIHPDVHYAEARRVLSGCQPLSAGYFAGRPAFVAQCGDRRRLHQLAEGDEPRVDHDLDVRGVVCSGGDPALRMGRQWLGLSAPASALEGLLPSDLAPSGSRAVWTGRELLVAAVRDGRFSVERRRCEGRSLRRLDAIVPLGHVLEGHAQSQP